ncbi:hypothetical protein MBLNU230_g2763t1 [Neophaeotheca triangularis]
MYFDFLPNEILTQIFLHLPTVYSALALSSTSQTFRSVYNSSKRLEILSQAIEREYGPSDDMIQLLTHNTSQPAHLHRNAPLSDALLKQMVSIGHTASKYTELYPSKKWAYPNHADRRLLTPPESRRLRQALYRLWLYTAAFHTPSHVRTARNLPQTLQTRAALLHNYTTASLASMLDLHLLLRELIAHEICPSNGSVRREFRSRHPDSSHQLLFNPSNPSQHQHHHQHPFLPSPSTSTKPTSLDTKYHATPHHEPGFEGWGDEIQHYYIVEDVLKLDPAQLLFLRDKCPLKWQVESFVMGLGEWFEQNGETFSETLGFVLAQRGVELGEVREAVEEGGLGVVCGGEV